MSGELGEGTDRQKELARAIIAITAMRATIDNEMKQAYDLYRLRRKEISDEIDKMTRELAISFGLPEDAAFNPDPANVPVFLEKEKPQERRRNEKRLHLVRGLLDDGGDH